MTVGSSSNKQWHHYYYRAGAKHGYQIAAVHKTPNLTGVWNVVMPWGKGRIVKTCQVNARSSVTSQPIAGVSY